MPSRPMPMTVAAVLLALFSLLNLATPLFPSEGVPAFIVYVGVGLGIAGLVGVVGLWLLRSWGLWLTIVVCVPNILSAAPGIAFAPDALLQAAATVTVVVFAIIIVLVV